MKYAGYRHPHPDLRDGARAVRVLGSVQHLPQPDATGAALLTGEPGAVQPPAQDTAVLSRFPVQEELVVLGSGDGLGGLGTPAPQAGQPRRTLAQWVSFESGGLFLGR